MAQDGFYVGKEPISIPAEMLQRAIEGNYGDLLIIFKLLSEALKQGKQLSPELASFLADALQKMADGGDPKAAFRIRRKRGERDTRAAVERAVLRAFKVAELLKQVAGPTKKKMTVECAIAKIALEEGALEETVRAAWRDYRAHVELSKESGWAFVNFTPVQRNRSKRKK